MEKELYEKFIQFLDALKSITEELNNSSGGKNQAEFYIAMIKSELDKSKTERDCFLVKSYMAKLEEINEIAPLINKSKHVVEYIYYNK